MNFSLCPDGVVLWWGFLFFCFSSSSSFCGSSSTEDDDDDEGEEEEVSLMMMTPLAWSFAAGDPSDCLCMLEQKQNVASEREASVCCVCKNGC